MATGDEAEEEENSPVFDIVIGNAGTENTLYDYSSLGETWSTPRIFRPVSYTHLTLPTKA